MDLYAHRSDAQRTADFVGDGLGDALDVSRFGIV